VKSNVWNYVDPGTPPSPKLHHKVWKPVVAAVHGICAGGGQYFINEADIVICSDDAAVLRSARQRRHRLGARADRHALSRRPARRRLALGADGHRGAHHRRHGAPARACVSEVVAATTSAVERARSPTRSRRGTRRRSKERSEPIWEALDLARTIGITNGMAYTHIGNQPYWMPEQPSEKRPTEYR
jgi:E-phenylitaconyl-CoA hydratase